jgi:glutathione synthase/RimK-type ligase-like ATP-grasp enzyme
VRLWCYDVDRGGWAGKLHAAAVSRNIDARLFVEDNPHIRAGDYVFMRIPQWEPELSEGKKLASVLIERGVKLIPDFFTIWSYEDKVLQTAAYRSFMPMTYVLSRNNTWQDAIRAIDIIGLPFISKAKEASASKNVRLIYNMVEARVEFESVFKGAGISIAVGKGRTGSQKGYVIWQRFCEKNDCDYRVCITGRKLMMLKRFNRPGTSFASGSGKNEPVNEPTEFEQGALDTARKFFDEMKLKWNGIDLVFDHYDGKWKVLETTLGWSLPAYANCVYFGTKRKGSEMFEMLLDELQEGVFA